VAKLHGSFTLGCPGGAPCRQRRFLRVAESAAKDQAALDDIFCGGCRCAPYHARHGYRSICSVTGRKTLPSATKACLHQRVAGRCNFSNRLSGPLIIGLIFFGFLCGREDQAHEDHLVDDVCSLHAHAGAHPHGPDSRTGHAAMIAMSLRIPQQFHFCRSRSQPTILQVLQRYLAYRGSKLRFNSLDPKVGPSPLAFYVARVKSPSGCEHQSSAAAVVYSSHDPSGRVHGFFVQRTDVCLIFQRG